MGIAAKIKELGFQGCGRVLKTPPLGRALIRGADRRRAPKFQIIVYHRVQPVFDPFSISTVTSVDISRPLPRAQVAYGLLEWFKGFAPAERDARIAELVALCRPGPASEERLMLDWDEVRAMHASRSGITFGAHTVNHPILARLGG